MNLPSRFSEGMGTLTKQQEILPGESAQSCSKCLLSSQSPDLFSVEVVRLVAVLSPAHNYVQASAAEFLELFTSLQPPPVHRS